MATRPATEPLSPSDLRWVWRAAWVVVAVIGLALMARAFLTGASTTIFAVVMAFFGALAIEPAVARLATRVPRPAATGIVMAGVGAGISVFLWQFGSLLFEQLAALIESVPDTLSSLFTWVNTKFGTDYAVETLLDDLGLSVEQLSSYAGQIAGGVMGVLGGAATALLGSFAFAFFLYFMSAGMDRLRGWVAELFPPRSQEVVLTTWEVLRIKVGGYVASRLLLAVISAIASGIFMAVTGMPYWLPLALWTGLVSQFIPNVGTYVAIALPALVGFTTDNPMLGVWVLVFGVAYQQVENLLLEPRISARAVDVHPATSFASALIGAELFGIAGAALGVPVAATIMAVFDIYKQRYAVSPETEERIQALVRATPEGEEEAAVEAAGAAEPVGKDTDRPEPA